MKIGIASDHGGYELKEKLTKYLTNKGYTVTNYGTDSLDSVDYPDFAFKVSESVAKGENDLGIAICKTGIGMSIAANKVKGIRCAKIDNQKEAKCAKEHNNANMIALGSNKSFIVVKRIINTFLNASSNIEERHINRINKITRYENEH